VLFCQMRSGGNPPAETDLRILEAPENDSIFAGLAHHFVRGPRYAPGKVGKGALAIIFSLTSLIDDKSECLASFYFEGLLRKHRDAGILLQALWGHNVTRSLTRKHVACHCWDDVLSHLYEHSRRNAPILGERTTSEGGASTQSGESGAASSASIAGSSDDECADGALLIDTALLVSSINLKMKPPSEASVDAERRDVDASTERLYTCAECGRAPRLGALDDDGTWYCDSCWLAVLSIAGSSDDECADGVGLAAEDDCTESVFVQDLHSSHKGEVAGKVESLSEADLDESFGRDCTIPAAGFVIPGATSDESDHGERLHTCADCGKSPFLGAIDEVDGNWYCKACWETPLSNDIS